MRTSSRQHSKHHSRSRPHFDCFRNFSNNLPTNYFTSISSSITKLRLLTFDHFVKYPFPQFPRHFLNLLSRHLPNHCLDSLPPELHSQCLLFLQANATLSFTKRHFSRFSDCYIPMNCPPITPYSPSPLTHFTIPLIYVISFRVHIRPSSLLKCTRPSQLRTIFQQYGPIARIQYHSTHHTYFLTYLYAESITFVLINPPPPYTVQRLKSLNDDTTYTPYVQALYHNALTTQDYFFYCLDIKTHWKTTLTSILSPYIQPFSPTSKLSSNSHLSLLSPYPLLNVEIPTSITPPRLTVLTNQSTQSHFWTPLSVPFPN